MLKRQAKAASAASNPGRISVAVVLAVVALLALAAPAFADEVLVPTGNYSGPGTDPGQLTDPGDAAVEQASGNLFVADTGNGRVDVFKADGSFLTSFGAAQLDAPFGIALREVGGQTQVYVSDGSTKQILRFDSDEAATPSFGLDGTYVSPALGSGADKVGNFAAPLALAPNGDLWVADPGDNLLQRYDATGTYTGSSINGAGSSAGVFTGLLDVAVDAGGQVYAVDANGRISGTPASQGGEFPNGQSRVERFAADGTFQLTLPGLTRPATVAVSSSSGDVAVSANQDSVDTDNSPSVYIFDSAGSERFSLRMNNSAQYTTVHGLAINDAGGEVWAVNDSGYYTGQAFGQEGIHRFQVVTLPTSTVATPTNVSYTTADLSGSVEPHGTTTTARFEVSSDAGSSWSDVSGSIPVCEVSAPGDCTGAPVPVAFSATGLAATTEYLVRLRTLVGGESASSLSSNTASFTTATVNPPVVGVPTVDQVTADSAKVAGTVEVENNPDPAFQASCRFEYQTQKSYEEAGNEYNYESRRVTCDVPTIEGSGPQPVAVKADITGLEPSVAYRVRLFATNAGGTTFTEAASTFTTETVAPVVTPAPLVDTNATSAIFAAYVNPFNSALSECRFVYGPTTAYGSEAPCASIPTGHVNKIVTAKVSGLAAATSYHYKLIAANSAGTVETGDRVFSTLAQDPGPPADNCANEAIRAQQLSTYLPSCRAYEMVTPPDKSGATVSAKPFNGAGQPIISAVSPDGNAAAFWAYAGFGDAVSAHQNTYRASRGAGGWSTTSVIPELPGPGHINIAPGKAQAVGVTPDLSRFFLRTGLAFDPKDERPFPNFGLGSPFDVYAVSPGGEAEWQSRPDGFDSDATNFESEWVGASPDGKHVFFQSEEALVPAASGRIAGRNLFERFEGHTRLVGVDSSGVALSECGSTFGPYRTPFSTYRGAVSADASKVYVTSPDPSGAETCGTQPHVYLNEGTTTVDASRSRRSVPDPDPKPVYFQGASKDGSVAYLLSDEALTEDASLGADGMLYVYDAGTDQLTLVAPSGVGGVSAMADDGSYVYYLRNGGGIGVDGDVYVYSRADDQTDLVAVNSQYYPLVNNSSNTAEARVTPDGNYFIFPSRANLTGFESQGFQELYRYDASQGNLRCISCDPSGAAPTADTYLGTANSLDNIFPINRPISLNLTTDGARAFFETANTLDGGDVNGAPDVFEWHEGRIARVSDGKTARGTFFFGASSDGRDVFLSTQEAVLPQDFDNGDVDIYDARIGGGFLRASSPAPCEGEGCQGEPGAVTPDQLGTTNAFSGPPNKGERKTQKQKKKHKKKSKKKKSKHKKKGQHRKGQQGKAQTTTKKGR